VELVGPGEPRRALGLRLLAQEAPRSLGVPSGIRLGVLDGCARGVWTPDRIGKGCRGFKWPTGTVGHRGLRGGVVAPKALPCR